MKKENPNSGQAVQLLFTLLLLFFLCISVLFVILFGAKVYENIGHRMDDNFTHSTALTYISNKVKQNDVAGNISIESREDTKVLKLTEYYNHEEYHTLVYYRDGKLKELFSKADDNLPLETGIDIMDSEGIAFHQIKDNLLQIDTLGDKGSSLILALRSQEGRYE